jgi:hypothetical protein
MKKNLIYINAIFLFLLSAPAWAIWGIGLSSKPMLSEHRYLSTEFTGDLSANGGVGIQGRYTHKVNKATLLDGGIGFSGGERSGNVFVGADYEIFPDYMQQPRFSLKATLESSREYNERKNKIGISPIFSKGFNFWGNDGYPYASVPMGVNLDSKTKSYDTFMKVSVGIIGKIPLEYFEGVTANIEGSMNLKGSSTGVFLGLSFPIHPNL